MKYYSEKLNRVFDTEDEVVKAEKEVEDKKAEEAKKSEEKKARAEEVKKAYAHINDVRKECAVKMDEAYKSFYDLRDAFIKDYGSFHLSFYEDGTKSEITVSDLISNAFKLPWIL